jgi:sulfur transfer protein SufE
MEPISTAMTFATIVSLMADFVSHRGAEESKDFDSFMAWLQEQRHEEIRSLLESNSTTVIGIKALLSESRQQILEGLTSLDQTLSSIASSIPLYREIAQLAHPTRQLSEQAISVLEQFYDAEASGFLESKIMRGVVLVFLDGKGGQVEYTESRFIEDDLTTLLELGLLDLQHNSKGERVFKFKRTAAALVEHRRRA